MRIQITGMSPRMVSQRSREHVTFARLLASALAADGHEVYQQSQVDVEADLVIAGVTSPLSPGATYALFGLEAIGRALKFGVPLLVFVDDPDLSKTRYGAISARDRIDRLYTGYLMAKRIKASANITADQKTLIRQATWMLAGEDWPPVLLPLHPWAMGRTATHAKKLGVSGEVIGIDVSSVLELPERVNRNHEHRSELWLTDRHYTNRLLDPKRVGWPVIEIDSRHLSTHPVGVYGTAKGVHQGLIEGCPGWWTPTPQYVALAGSVYLMDGDESVMLGSENPYYLTPDYVEACAPGEHALLSRLQHEHLKETMWSRGTLSSILAELTGRFSS